MVKGGTILVIGRSADGGATGEGFLHLWPRARSTVRCRARSAERSRAWSTRHVGVTSNWCKVCWPSSEVVVEVVSATAHVVIPTGLERTVRSTGRGAMKAGQAAVVWTSGLPVYGLNAVLESGRGAELPLADECPDDTNCHYDRSQYGDDNDSGVAGR